MRSGKFLRWRVEKENLYFGEINASPDFAGVYEMMSDIPPSDLAVHGYELSVRKDTELVSYTTIVEVHHPDYLNLDQLVAIYSTDGSEEISGGGLPLPALGIVRDSLSSY